MKLRIIIMTAWPQVDWDWSLSSYRRTNSISKAAHHRTFRFNLNIYRLCELSSSLPHRNTYHIYVCLHSIGDVDLHKAQNLEWKYTQFIRYVIRSLSSSFTLFSYHASASSVCSWFMDRNPLYYIRNCLYMHITYDTMKYHTVYLHLNW